MVYQDLFFDLDGTLTDSAPGICEATRRTLAHYGIAATSEELLRFVGPPLSEAFRTYYGFSPEKAKAAVAFWREIYHAEELWKSRPFDGVRDLLEALSARGYRLHIATSKPQHLAEWVLAYAGLSCFFRHIVGATLDDSRNDKVSVLCECLRISGAEKSASLMIGDRIYDVDGAQKNGIAALGVLYGYGERSELANAVYIAENVNDILHFLQ